MIEALCIDTREYHSTEEKSKWTGVRSKIEGVRSEVRKHGIENLVYQAHEQVKRSIRMQGKWAKARRVILLHAAQDSPEPTKATQATQLAMVRNAVDIHWQRASSCVLLGASIAQVASDMEIAGRFVVKQEEKKRIQRANEDITAALTMEKEAAEALSTFSNQAAWRVFKRNLEADVAIDGAVSDVLLKAVAQGVETIKMECDEVLLYLAYGATTICMPTWPESLTYMA